VSGQSENTTADGGVPALTDADSDPAPQDVTNPDEAAAGRSLAARSRWARRIAAVRRWFQDSVVGQPWRRLQLLDFINRGILFAAVLLLASCLS
jgi:hypothetical protein